LDSIERTDDLECLFNTLNKYKDIKKNPPCITANTIVANPDFEKIKETSFNNYYYRTINESYYEFSDGEKVINLLKDGISDKLIFPQFHGREHLNVPLWLKALRNNDQFLRLAFNNKVFSIESSGRLNSKRNATGAFDSLEKNDIDFYLSALKDGLEIFRKFFGFNSLTMIAPSYTWNDQIEKAAHDCGIVAFQGISYQFLPSMNGSLKKKFHYTGQRNQLGQYYLVRNVFFEPSLIPDKDWVSECLKRIDLAFKFRRPAIIGTHRVNFIGTLVEKNRTNNLKLFNHLLSQILKRWPDVEFASSADLIKLITDKQQG